MSYAARTKYDEPGRAARYGKRSPKRDREEWRLLEGFLRGLPERPRSALDVPCGTGRVAERLIEAGIPTQAADLSPAMRKATEARLGGRAGYRGVVPLDLEAVPAEPDLRADLVVCFRFLHHLPDPETRARALGGLASLTGRDLLLSFHHPVSAHNVKRQAKRLLLARQPDRYTLWPARLAVEAKEVGLELAGMRALGRWRRELWVGWFQVRT